MTEREKLIEILLDGVTFTDTYKNTAQMQVEYVADHLLAHGVIVPPCKVGDIVYAKGWWWRDGDDVATYQITNITITQNKKGEWTKKYRAMRFLNGKTIDYPLNFSFEEIGKTVFLTKEEAEKALAEMEKK